MSARNASERAYEYVQHRILDGTYAMGSKLVEDRLAREAGVSRTPIREALRRLAADGLVVVEPHCGARVASIARSELLEIYSLRAALESQVAARACLHMDYATLDKLEGLAEDMERLAGEGNGQELSAESVRCLIDLNGEFHGLLVERARSPWHAKSLFKLLQIPLMYRTIGMYTPQELARSQGHHREIIAAFVARDPEWAASTMRSHILAARATLLRAFGDRKRGDDLHAELGRVADPPLGHTDGLSWAEEDEPPTYGFPSVLPSGARSRSTGRAHDEGSRLRSLRRPERSAHRRASRAVARRR